MPHFSEFTTSNDLRAALVANVRTYGLIRYRHQGKTREFGVDCLGLVVVNALDFGFDFNLETDDGNYSMNPDGYYLADRFAQETVPLETWRDAKPGDIVLMRWHIETPPQHVGIVTSIEPDNLICMHASRHSRKVAETRWPDEHLITHGFRIREIAALEALEALHG